MNGKTMDERVTTLEKLAETLAPLPGEVAGLTRELGASGVGYEIRQSMGADVGEQVLEVARQESASLVVVGVRRRSPVGKLIMGSVAQHVILGAACPVLAVKP